MLALLMLLAGPSAALHHRCPDVTPVDNFNMSGIGRGRWYEVARYPVGGGGPAGGGPAGGGPAGCVSYAAGMRSDLYVATTDTVPRSSPHFAEVRCRAAPDARGAGKLTLTMLSGDSRVLVRLPAIYILAVDYDEYCIPYGCVYDEDKDEVKEFVWILSRTRPTSGRAKEQFIDLARRALHVEVDRLVWIDHETCTDEVSP